MVEDGRPSLTESLSKYVALLKKVEQRNGQQELNRFIKWCGRDTSVDKLTPSGVAEYAESAGMWGADSARTLKPVKAFLTFLKEAKLTKVSLAPHLKHSRINKGTRRVFFKSASEHAELSPEGYANLQSRLELLKEERLKVVGDIQRAMADKDFKENAPLDAAKERQGFIESSIRELDSILTTAVVQVTAVSTKPTGVKMGTTVTLRDVTSGKKVRYTVVHSREADPSTGRISSASPVGKALLDKVKGDEVHISVPKGTLHYVVEKVER